jgi:hypothetical protein
MSKEMKRFRITEKQFEELRENYRIPTIDEFVDGFEFEVYSEGYIPDSIEDLHGWYKYKFGYNNWRDLDEIQIELDLGNIRCYIIKMEKI